MMLANFPLWVKWVLTNAKTVFSLPPHWNPQRKARGEGTKGRTCVGLDICSQQPWLQVKAGEGLTELKLLMLDPGEFKVQI